MQQVKNDNVKFFEENKYVKLPQVLNSQVNQLLYEYVKTSAYKCKLIQDWSFFSTHPNYYNIDDHGYFDDPLTPGDFAKYGDMASAPIPNRGGRTAFVIGFALLNAPLILCEVVSMVGFAFGLVHCF